MLYECNILHSMRRGKKYGYGKRKGERYITFAGEMRNASHIHIVTSHADKRSSFIYYNKKGKSALNISVTWHKTIVCSAVYCVYNVFFLLPQFQIDKHKYAKLWLGFN